MTTQTSPASSPSHRGFSLIELMVVILLLTVVMGAIFQLISVAMQRSSTEQSRLDTFQQAREFMDQMARDLRSAGYPNIRNFTEPALTDPIKEDAQNAVGLVEVDDGVLQFEGDVDGAGTVSVVRYFLDPSTENNCPCLKRSQVAKVDGNPVDDQTPLVSG